VLPISIFPDINDTKQMAQQDLTIAHTRENESDNLQEKMRVIAQNLVLSYALTLRRKHQTCGQTVHYFKNC
jgi:hypothetical protein